MAAENHRTSDSMDFASELDSSLGHSITTHSSSFRAEMKMTTTKNKCLKQSSLDEDDFINLLHGSDPVKIELNRLENDVRGMNDTTLIITMHFFLFLLFQWYCNPRVRNHGI